MRCGARLVSVEAVAAEVQALCGAPDFRDRRVLPLRYGYDADTEVWYYNRGPSRLVRVLTFRDGRLTDVATDGYGFVPPAQPQCSPGDLREGMSKYRLLAFWAEPVPARGDAGRRRRHRGTQWRRPRFPAAVSREPTPAAPSGCTTAPAATYCAPVDGPDPSSCPLRNVAVSPSS
jgi:hypothetical protein